MQKTREAEIEKSVVTSEGSRFSHENESQEWKSMGMNKIKSEHQSAVSTMGYLGENSTPCANKSLQQTGVVVACFLQVQRAAAKLKR